MGQEWWPQADLLEWNIEPILGSFFDGSTGSGVESQCSPSLREDQSRLGTAHLQYSQHGQSQARLFTATLLQLRILGFGMLRNGDVGVGVGVFLKGNLCRLRAPQTLAASASAPSEVFTCKALAQITSRRAKCGMKVYRRCLPEFYLLWHYAERRSSWSESAGSSHCISVMHTTGGGGALMNIGR